MLQIPRLPPLPRLPRLSRRRWAAVLLALVILLPGTVAVMPASYRWGTLLAARKAVGLLPDVSWADIGVITRPDLGFNVPRLVHYGDPYSYVQNPLAAVPAARERGKALFADNCSKCHGAGAKGGMGPALFGRAFKHGGSDWAVYRTITSGVPGTAMVGGFIDRGDAWSVISYLRGLEDTKGTRRSSLADPYTARLGEAPEVTPAQLVAAADEKGQWLLPSGSYDGRRYSLDTQVNTDNVAHLAMQWMHQFPSTEAPNESVPVVVGDYIYVTVPPGAVYAIDARTGRQAWHYDRPVPADLRLCCLATGRGVAVSGRRVYVGTLDAHLLALDASTGRLLWDRQVADYKIGYSITSAPLPIGDLVVTGEGGGEFPTRGFLVAYEAATGRERWRFQTIPGDGEPGRETWDAKAWPAGGPTWGHGSYDPELGLVYWGVGTAAPDFNAAVRSGDNLYTSSMIALDAKTGRLVWHFQFLPGDDHDWDSIQTPSLIDVKENGTVHRWLAVANRGGFFYVLDRQTGTFIRGAPFARQTWALGLDAAGHPIRAAAFHTSPQGVFLYPSFNGATNWWPSAYSPLAQLYYVNVEDGGGVFIRWAVDGHPPGAKYLGGTATFGEDAFEDVVRAIDPMTAQIRWERKNATVTGAPRGGLLATAGGLLLGSDGMLLYALDAASGRELWSFSTGGHISAAPITYRSGGRQVIAVVAGQDLVTFALPAGSVPPAPPAQPLPPRPSLPHPAPVL